MSPIPVDRPGEVGRYIANLEAVLKRAKGERDVLQEQLWKTEGLRDTFDECCTALISRLERASGLLGRGMDWASAKSFDERLSDNYTLTRPIKVGLAREIKAFLAEGKANGDKRPDTPEGSPR